MCWRCTTTSASATRALIKIAEATAEERADEASLLRWSRFFAATTEEELEEIAMADPVIEEARNVLQAVSDDPMAREIARGCAARGGAERRCAAPSRVGPLNDAHATLAASDAEALQQRFNALVRDRAWAS